MLDLFISCIKENNKSKFITLLSFMDMLLRDFFNKEKIMKEWKDKYPIINYEQYFDELCFMIGLTKRNKNEVVFLINQIGEILNINASWEIINYTLYLYDLRKNRVQINNKNIFLEEEVKKKVIKEETVKQIICYINDQFDESLISILDEYFNFQLDDSLNQRISEDNSKVLFKVTSNNQEIDIKIIYSDYLHKLMEYLIVEEFQFITKEQKQMLIDYSLNKNLAVILNTIEKINQKLKTKYLDYQYYLFFNIEEAFNFLSQFKNFKKEIYKAIMEKSHYKFDK